MRSPTRISCGPTGSITAVDASPQMLRQAQRRAGSAGWDNVYLIEADATALEADTVHAADGFDAVISTYALSPSCIPVTAPPIG